MPLRICFIAAAALLSGAIAASAQSPGPKPGGQKGMISVSVKVEGKVIEASKFDSRVRRTWTVNRQARFQIPVVAQMTTAWDSLAPEPRPAPAPPPSADQADIGREVQKALAGCNPDDDLCMEAALQKFAVENIDRVKVPSEVPQAPTGAPDFTRYQTWVGDRSGPCVSGTASLNETMSGTQIPDNGGPLWQVEGNRSGEIQLPAKGYGPQSCQTQVSFDLKGNTYSLRLNGMRISVPVVSYVHRKGGGKEPPRNFSFGLFDYSDTPLKGDALQLANQGGGVSGFEGSIVIPSKKGMTNVDDNITPDVRTTVTWSFVPH